MVSKAQKARLAVFFIVGFVVLLSIFVLVLGSRITERRDTYYVVYEGTSVAGLQMGSAVLYHGIRIGRVEDIQIDRERIINVVVTISVQRGTPIKADQEAALVSVGITGLKQIEIRGGTDDSPFLKPGDTIPAGRTLFENIADRAEVLAHQFEQIMANIIEITNEANQERLASILASVDNIVSESQSSLIQTVANVGEITSEMAIATVAVTDAMQKINELLHSEEINNIIANTEIVTANMAKLDINSINNTITSLNESIQRATTTISRIDAVVHRSSPEINATILELRETIENLNEFSRLITDDPSMLIRSRRSN